MNKSTLFYILALIHFVIFAYDFENDKDLWTWGWLLICMLWFYNSAIYYKKN